MNTAVKGPKKSITLAHGSGGKAMHDLIQQLIVKTFDNEWLSPLEDQARFDLTELMARGDRLAMTTDSYVVDPLFFPGGDIGKLAVTGTVNDLAVGGATPLYLTCGLIIEEGLAIDTLAQILVSMKKTADEAGVSIVTGDTKVVHKGAADKLFINTAGIGVIDAAYRLSPMHIKVGDQIVVNGYIGDHGAAIVDARGELAIENSIETDCQPLNAMIRKMLEKCPTIRVMRDATRGGVATVLNEFATVSNLGMQIDEHLLPVRPEVRGMCELLGLDPLYLANEGKVVAIVPKDEVTEVLSVMHNVKEGKNAVVIGEVTNSHCGNLVMKTTFGSERMMDVLVGDQLPRIC